MSEASLPVVFMRGGTSKGLVFRSDDLPVDRADWDPIFLAAIGTPDPNGRQLDGMGGGVSSLSKVCVVGPSSRPDADVDYTFAQLSIREPVVDYAGNCGNMSSAIGPFALAEGLVPPQAGDEAVVRIHNTNTGKIIRSRFPLRNGQPEIAGDYALDGVAGTAAPIRLEFLEPGGAKTGRLLPTGNATDLIEIDGLGEVTVSLVDAGNPFVFVAAADLGAAGTELPAEIQKNAVLLDRLERLRLAGSVLMGLAPDLAAAARIVSIPKIAMLSAPVDAPTLSGATLSAGAIDILSRSISVGQAHNAIPLTGALCLAAACAVPGSVANRLLSPAADMARVRIGHPSGTIDVAAAVSLDGNALAIPHISVFRTARRLMKGEVFYRT
jgi:2-methylaconitate cis-trans-isomerase PrpF